MRGSIVVSLFAAAVVQTAAIPVEDVHDDTLPSNYLFIFGDSYTTTGFNVSLEPQPSLQYPLGNPAYPGATFDGRNAANTSQNENWVGFLVYNSSLPSTVAYNYAVGGNVVNITALNDTVVTNNTIDFIEQEAQFENIDPSVPWTGSNSVFITWFGINDVSFNVFGSTSHPEAEAETVLHADVDSYYNLLTRLYNKGARKFITILCPPIYRAPENGYGQGDTVPEVKNLTSLWNSLVQSGHQDWTSQHPSANAVIYDPTDLFNTILDNPTAYGVSSSSCISYPYGQPCAWTDFIHTGVVIQEHIAQEVAPVVKELQSAR